MDKKILFFFVLLIITSCNFNNEKVMMTELNEDWKKNEIKKISFEIQDFQNPKNIIFVLRNNNDYPYSNIFVFAELKNDKNQPIAKVDTLHYVIAEPNGNWKGTGFGETKEILLQMKDNFSFPKNGNYTLELKHGMRSNALKGITELGVLIEDAKK